MTKSAGHVLSRKPILFSLVFLALHFAVLRLLGIMACPLELFTASALKCPRQAGPTAQELTYFFPNSLKDVAMLLNLGGWKSVNRRKDWGKKQQ